MHRSAHTDSFARDNLPPQNMWPDIDLSKFDYGPGLNAAVELTDTMVARGFGDNVALIGNGRRRTYKELTDWTNRLAHALVDDLKIEPGNRVLIRSANNPAMVVCWLAATKVGAVVVNTMPLLRTGELLKYVEKAEITHALCDTRLMDEMTACAKQSKWLKTVVGFDGTANHDAELDRLALDKPVGLKAVPTASDDVALIGFTSGSTGEPKGTMHFHRDLMIIADGYADEVLGVTPDDVFIGSPPCLHLRSRRPRCLSPSLRGRCDTARDRYAAQSHRDDRAVSGDSLFHCANRLSRNAGGDGGWRRPVVAARRGVAARRCRRRSITNG